MEIRDRVVDLRRVRAKDLMPNPKNWRRNPKVQANALRGLLNEIGIADALLVRELADGRLQLVDGHLHADVMPNEEVPVLILDLNEAEADKLLLTLDPLAAMASADGERLGALLDSVRTDDPAIQVLLDELRTQEEGCWRTLTTLPIRILKSTSPKNYAANGAPKKVSSGTPDPTGGSAATAAILRLSGVSLRQARSSE